MMALMAVIPGDQRLSSAVISLVRDWRKTSVLTILVIIIFVRNCCYVICDRKYKVRSAKCFY